MIDLNRIAIAILMVPAVIVVGIVRLIRPLFLVRFGVFDSARIGHLAANTEIYLGERELGLHPRGFLGGIDLWAHKCAPCNRQLAKMIARKLWVDPTRFVQLIYMVNMKFQGWERHYCAPDNWDRDIHDTYAKTKQHISFTEGELARGRKQLAAWGLKPEDKWVCLIVRDAKYLPRAFAYHDFRDSKVKSYRRAALALAERGYHVFRMGAAVEEPLGVDHPMIADYATNGMRSDFMDIYLGAHCSFALTNGCGIDAVPVLFRKPICHVNGASIEYMRTWAHGIYIWKHHWRRSKRMTPAEIFASGAGQYEQADSHRLAKIQLRDNTAQEIEDAAVEMCDTLTGKASQLVENYYNTYSGLTVADLNHFDQQMVFWQSFPSATIVNHNGKRIHGAMRLRIGRKFLESYQ